MPLFYNVRQNLTALFSPRNICIQLLACVLSYVLVISGFDWVYFLHVHGSLLSTYVSPAVFIGGLVPVIGLPFLYIVSKVRKSELLLITTWTLAQAAVLSWCFSSVYKAFTGRVQPPRVITDTMTDMSHNWNFGFFEHGIFWGWPSSHTTVAFAMSFALIALYAKHPKKNVIFWLALLYSFYIGIGISMQIHWFSEFIAGALIGGIIGTVVGKRFRVKLMN